MSTAQSSTLAELECPVCMLIPRKEIYQCSNGHSICHNCVTKVDLCPTCRVAVSGPQTVQVRNHYAETFLDGMKFSCGWQDEGCDVSLARGELSDHENVCQFRAFNMCKAFNCSSNCQFQFSTIDLGNNPEKITEVLDHMKCEHGFNVMNPMRWMKSRNMVFTHDFLNDVNGDEQLTREWSPGFQKVISETCSSEMIFVALICFEEDAEKQKWFSFAFAMFTEEKEEEISNSIKVKVEVKGQSDLESAENWGDNCVPDLMWTMKPMSTCKLKNFLKMPLADRPQFPFGIPISVILKHYVDDEGKFTIQYSFHKE